MREEKKLSRGEKRAKKIHDKFGSPIIELAIEEENDVVLDIAYAKFIVARYRSHQLLRTSLIFWVLCIISIVASIFISAMLLVTWTLLLWSITLQVMASQYEARADHLNNFMLIVVQRNDIDRIKDALEASKKKGKKNGGRPRKTQRKSA